MLSERAFKSQNHQAVSDDGGNQYFDVHTVTGIVIHHRELKTQPAEF